MSQKLRIVWQTVFHDRTPLSAKGMLLGGLLYGILPIDLIPDILPVLGQMDDAAVIIFAVFLFLRLSKNIRRELEDAASQIGTHEPV